VGITFKGVLALKKESMKKIVFFVFFTVFAAAFAKEFSMSGLGVITVRKNEISLSKEQP